MGSHVSLRTAGSEEGRTRSATGPSYISLLMCGDVMTGRGIDQVLAHPSDPRIYEPYMRSALGYVELAERANGPIRRPVNFSYVWGDALEVMEQAAADVLIVNLETAVTRSDDYWRGKGINYRMHPNNTPCLTAAGIDCCVLANNHVLDWGYAGLRETLDSLRSAGLAAAGAGRDLNEAWAPAVLQASRKGRVIVFSFGSVTSGIPRRWAAAHNLAGVALLEDLSGRTIAGIAERIGRVKQPYDVVVASIHWGGNWGYAISPEQTDFAHRLIDEAGVDVIHGHSSHHTKGLEVYRDKPIIYGCGDFLNDYEGISGYEAFRDDLVLLYRATVDAATGRLAGFNMTPFQIRQFRLHRVSRQDAEWLRDTLDREGRTLGTGVRLGEANRLSLEWG